MMRALFYTPMCLSNANVIQPKYMYLKLTYRFNDILRRLLGVPRHTSARFLFVNKRQDNVDVQTRKQCYNLKLSIEGSHNRVIESIFDSCSFKASKLFAK